MRNKDIKVKLVRDVYRNGAITPCKIHLIDGAAKIVVPFENSLAGKEVRAGDRISDAESDLVCRIYNAHITIPSTHPV